MIIYGRGENEYSWYAPQHQTTDFSITARRRFLAYLTFSAVDPLLLLLNTALFGLLSTF